MFECFVLREDKSLLEANGSKVLSSSQCLPPRTSEMFLMVWTQAKKNTCVALMISFPSENAVAALCVYVTPSLH